MSLVSTSGFAIRRNGTCYSNEVDCGITVRPFRACCPAGASCPSAFNVDCCPSPANCTETLLKNPSCANKTWTLYDNEGFFCCDPSKIGYAASLTGSDGCAHPGFPPQGAKLLRIISAGQTPATSSASTTSSTVSSSSTVITPSPDSPANSTLPSETSNSAGHSNTGAIVGGVIGGFAAVVILLVLIGLFRKRKSKVQRQNLVGDDKPKIFEKDGTTRTPDINEASGESVRYELPDNREDGNVAELP
ncbi:hypothetical protein B7463_g10868, partial [Scytalidium lignicola]